MRDLLQQGAARPENQWPLDRDMSLARNKHRSNTVAELRAGLVGPYDWFESDIRIRAGVPVTSHDVQVSRDAMRVDDWLKVGAASGRGLKFDFKEPAAILPVVGMLREAQVPDERIILNVGFLGDAAGGTSLSTLKALRTLFPKATLNLSPRVSAYTPPAIDALVAAGQAVGGPVMFPLNAALVTPEVVAGLKPGGRVAIWNDPSTFDPPDLAAAAARFRSWGVDGMIDLRHADVAAAK